MNPTYLNTDRLTSQRSISPVLITSVPRKALTIHNSNTKDRSENDRMFGVKFDIGANHDKENSYGNHVQGGTIWANDLRHQLIVEEPKKVVESPPIAPIVESYFRGRPSACVFVASLHARVDDDALSISVTELFQQWGKLASVKVLRDPANRPYAFVQYTNDQDCMRALKYGHNTLLNGRNIRCEHARVNRTLFITSNNTLSQTLVRGLLEVHGEIERLAASDIHGCLNTSLQGSKCWYSKFVYRDDAIRAFACLTAEKDYKVEWTQNINTIESAKSVQVDNSVSFDKYTVFVGQLSLSVREQDLIERFSRHGSISNLELFRRHNLGYAFITFKDGSSAASSVERENHTLFCDKIMHVQYKDVGLKASKSSSAGPNGIDLAPPPINFSKRFYSGEKRISRKAFGPPKFKLRSIDLRSGSNYKGFSSSPSSPRYQLNDNDSWRSPKDTAPLYYYIPINGDSTNAHSNSRYPYYSVSQESEFQQ